MSIIDRMIAAVTPPESDEARLEARTKATRAALPGDWLDQILQHHMDIEDAFADVRAASDAASRTAQLKQSRSGPDRPCDRRRGGHLSRNGKRGCEGARRHGL